MQLTQRQQEVLTFLENRLRNTGLMPSTRELQQHFGFASQTAAVNHLRALERKGVIKRLAGKARAVRLTARPSRQNPDGRRVVDVPLFGDIPPEGVPANETPEIRPADAHGCISLDLESIGVSNRSRTFALRMRGDAMVEAHVMDGDLIILESRPPRRNDIVAILHEGETVLRRLSVEDGKPVLTTENGKRPEITPMRDVTVQGVMIALIRPAATELAARAAGTATVPTAPRRIVQAV